MGAMSYDVSTVAAVQRPTAIVAARTTWERLPSLWPEMLDEVWTCLRAGGIHSGCPNVMLYLDDVPHVQVGVQLTAPCPLTGRVIASVLPAGRAATTVHHGPYAGLGKAHRAILDWCAAAGERPTGIRWEIYGPHRDDSAQIWTEVHYLLR